MSDNNEVVGGDGQAAVNALTEAFQVLLASAKENPQKPKNPDAFKNIEAKVDYDMNSKRIKLPGDPRKMTFNEAAVWLKRLEAADEEVINIHEVIDAHPWDGAVAFMKAMKEVYGWATPAPTPGFFGPQPPHMVSIDTDFGETATIFWGSFKLPGLDDTLLTCGVDEGKGRPLFRVQGKTKRKYVEAVHILCDIARRIVTEDSIYRGKALRLLVNGEGNIDYNQPPHFIDLSRVNPAELVFSESLMTQIETNLWAPILHTDVCRLHKVPLKRGVLLSGPYGTGKTLCASVTAKYCRDHKWTFITVPRVTALEAALRFAAGYQPCVVFVEDIDREMAGERTAKMDDILNTVDGIISKGAEIMVVLTTNDVEKINRAMLRPGRLDAVLHIDAPDAKAAEKLIRVYARDRVKPDTDLTEAGLALKGRIPAVIREAVERSKLYALSTRPGTDWYLTGSDIKAAAEGMSYHLELLAGKKPPEESAGDRMLAAFLEGINEHMANGYDSGLSKLLKTIGREVNEVHRHIID